MIKILAMDVDGTLTDGKVYIGDNGEIMKAFNIKDGYAIYKFLPENNILPVIVTGRISKIVEKRAVELGIKEVYQGISDKLAAMKEIAEKHNCKYDEIAYIGDDENDLPAMNIAGVVGCPADASASVKKVASFVSSCNGGSGAVREFVEWIIENEHCL
jgi:3-deoxy-D-manno-octulosonate 8-phosphate phosphatase (KDO 8-P phosphatase)